MKTLANAAIVAIIFVGLFFGYDIYKKWPVQEFCEALPNDISRDGVISAANEKGLWINPLDTNTNSVWVFNQRSPWGRYACIVEFGDRGITSKRVIDAE